VPAKTVEFDFDLGEDTAMSVASEMVEDLALSAEDARAIAAAIKDEIKLLTGLLDRRGDDSLASSSERVRPLQVIISI
jgi:Oxidative-stress-responsive kinase 1 C-terminal domain